MTRADVLVIGAGIVGASIASALAAEGRQVHVLSTLAPGDGATAAGMGHLVVLDDDPAELDLSRWSLELWRDSPHLATGEYRDCGTLWLATADHELAALRDKQQRLQAAGIGCEWIDPQALAVAEPSLRRGLVAGLRVAGDGVLYAPRVAWALLHDEGRGRITWESGATVRALLPGGVQLDDGRRLDAGAVVLAAGLDSARLLPELRFLPRKGHLAITDRCALPLRHQVVEVGYGASAHGGADSLAFNLQPRPTGQLLIGSCRQVGRDDRTIDPAMLGRMVGRAVAFVPALADVPVLRAWTGVRPGSADGRPCIGRWPLLRDVWIAAGHEGLGITTAPATAQLIVAQMAGQATPIDATPFDPARMVATEAAA
ncbi:NAD(P)/FAD-dependent oxidoreductase [Aquabacterium humicola]|uniref:NAD(P)/FAD-dependent oxidoreductase n=1 Tax=Aquabacterium humicola TaxID=3237377 RepID=UPI002542E215|nr:FAD-dependent oxidoreductase [Rubrivivax pictus]